MSGPAMARRGAPHPIRHPAAAMLAAVALACGGATSSFAQADAAANWPSKPIHAMVPLAPGTGGDVVARLALNALSQTLGQSIVIENKGGAGGTIGAGQVAKAEPDGYALLVHSSTHVIASALYTNLPYDTANDFAAVAPIGVVPSALVVSPSKGFKDLKDFVDKAKANAAGFTYASAGVGATTHLTAERFRISAGFNAVHVPFRGGGFQPEIIAGRVDFGYSPIATSLPNIKEGRLQALAVSSPKRATALPDVPTTLEMGYADSDYVIWFGIFLPAKTPRAIVDKLADATRRTLEQPALRERFAGLDVSPMPMSPREFDALVRKDIVANAALAKAAGLKPN
ncbi:MAG: tripartite tricarboxylate transporter substrate binding protein [Xanthobacteraceae bacterium]|nr:tripartite tricarboxylate transporter substrate binding protein [Xanthobacteraceae bacterium]